MAGSTRSVDLRFSELACSLAPRATGARCRGAERFQIEFAHAALGIGTLERIAATEELALGRGRPGRTTLEGSLAALDELEGALAHPEGVAILRAAVLEARRPTVRGRIMGVVNVTPDSFSDGGLHDDAERAIEHGLKLASEGADILDVGGESTRPGASQVSANEECARVVPVIRGLAREVDCALSIDTTKASVARAALEAGATIVNDVSAGRFDPELLPTASELGAGVVLMHMQRTPRDMQDAPAYNDVTLEVTEHLRARVGAALDAGIDADMISIDPGIGFGKRLEDNLELIRSLPELRSLGLPIVLGVSRKSFLGTLSGETNPARRDAETIAAISVGAMRGADVHRVHDVASTRAALDVVEALRRDEAGGTD